MAVQTPTTRWKPQALVGELARAGWGDLAGADTRGATAVLAALADVVDRRTGAGTATLSELAGRAQYSRRWTSESLQRLEDVGLVEYTPGGVAAGRPVPSRFRIVKAVLVKVLITARRARSAALEAQYQEVRERIATYRLMWTRREPRSGHNRRSRLANSLPPSPPQGGTPAAVPAVERPPDPDFARDTRGAARAWAALRGGPPA